MNNKENRVNCKLRGVILLKSAQLFASSLPLSFRLSPFALPSPLTPATEDTLRLEIMI